MQLCFLLPQLWAMAFKWRGSVVSDVIFLLLAIVGMYLRILLALFEISECDVFGMMDYCLCVNVRDELNIRLSPGLSGLYMSNVTSFIDSFGASSFFSDSEILSMD